MFAAEEEIFSEKAKNSGGRSAYTGRSGLQADDVADACAGFLRVIGAGDLAERVDVRDERLERCLRELWRLGGVVGEEGGAAPGQLSRTTPVSSGRTCLLASRSSSVSLTLQR